MCTKKGKKGTCYVHAFFLFRCRHRHRENIIIFYIIVSSRLRSLPTTTTPLATQRRRKRTRRDRRDQRKTHVFCVVGSNFTTQTVCIKKRFDDRLFVSRFLILRRVKCALNKKGRRPVAFYASDFTPAHCMMRRPRREKSA